MKLLGSNKNVVFIGYNVKYGKAGNTLIDVDESQLIETPVAENLMAGMAIGLSIEGYIPVVYIERCDFVLNALDAIVNHLDKISLMSHGEYNPRMIIRLVIGIKNKPFYTGLTHTQDFTKALQELVSFPVIKLPNDYDQILQIYKSALESNTSTIILEERDAY